MENRYPKLTSIQVAAAFEKNSGQLREVYKNDGCCGGNGPNCKCR